MSTEIATSDFMTKFMSVDPSYKKLTVLSTGTTRPFIKVRYDRLEKLSALLDHHQIENQVEENILSVDGGPYIATVELGWKTDVQWVQTLLDGVEFS